MSLVATLICNPADPALDSTVVDGARAILPSPGAAQWLFHEVAVDIPFTGSDDIRQIENRLREARGDLPIDIVEVEGLAQFDQGSQFGGAAQDRLGDLAGQFAVCHQQLVGAVLLKADRGCDRIGE